MTNLTASHALFVAALVGSATLAQAQARPTAPAAAPRSAPPAAPARAQPQPRNENSNNQSNQRPAAGNSDNSAQRPGTTPNNNAPQTNRPANAPDPRVNPVGTNPNTIGTNPNVIGTNPTNPPTGAGPLTGRGQVAPSATGVGALAPNGVNSGVPDGGVANGTNTGRNGLNRRGRNGSNQPYVIVPNGFAPWAWYNNSGWYWQYGDDYRNYWGQWNDNDSRTADAGPAVTQPPASPIVQPTAPPVNPNPLPAQDQARALNQLEASPAYRQAVADLAQAEQEHDVATRRVLGKLKQNDPDYRRLMEQKEAAADQVEAVQASARAPNPDRVMPAAQAKLNIGTEITRREQDSLAADPEATAAKGRLSQAQQRVAVMRKQAQVSATGG